MSPAGCPEAGPGRARAGLVAIALTFVLCATDGSGAFAQAPGVPQPERAHAYLVVLAGSLNVREAPALGAPVRRAMPRGATLCLVRYEGDWAEVTTPRGAEGAPPPTRGFVSRGFVSERRTTTSNLAGMGCGPEG